VGIDEETALINDASGRWRAEGAGKVTVYGEGDPEVFPAGSDVPLAR